MYSFRMMTIQTLPPAFPPQWIAAAGIITNNLEVPAAAPRRILAVHLTTGVRVKGRAEPEAV